MVVLHVGFAKTGTTFLQTGLFARCPGIRYLGKPYASDSLGRLALDICFQDSSTFDLDRSRSVWGERDRWVSGGGPYVISEEGLTFHEARDSLLCAQRCADIFGESRILFTLRNQLHTLESYFRHHAILNTTCHACRGRVRSHIGDWLEYQWLATERRFKTCISNLLYHAVISKWVEVFGRDRVEIRLFEEMRSDPGGFFAELCDLLGVEAVAPPSMEASRLNRGRSGRRLLFEQLRNRLWRDPDYQLATARSPLGSLGSVDASGEASLGPLFRFLERGRPVSVRMPDSWRARLTEFFREDNERLAVDYGIDLREHGYPL